MKTIVFDFDGVIHSYTSKWENAWTIPDPPVKGIREVLEKLKKDKYRIVVVTSRAATPAGQKAVNEYLNDNGMSEYISDVTAVKVPATCYVDDRGITFDGNTEGLAEQIESFRPWNR